MWACKILWLLVTSVQGQPVPMEDSLDSEGQSTQITTEGLWLTPLQEAPLCVTQ